MFYTYVFPGTTTTSFDWSAWLSMDWRETRYQEVPWDEPVGMSSQGTTPWLRLSMYFLDFVGDGGLSAMAMLDQWSTRSPRDKLWSGLNKFSDFRRTHTYFWFLTHQRVCIRGLLVIYIRRWSKIQIDWNRGSTDHDHHPLTFWKFNVAMANPCFHVGCLQSNEIRDDACSSSTWAGYMAT